MCSEAPGIKLEPEAPPQYAGLHDIQHIGANGVKAAIPSSLLAVGTFKLYQWYIEEGITTLTLCSEAPGIKLEPIGPLHAMLICMISST